MHIYVTKGYKWCCNVCLITTEEFTVYMWTWMADLGVRVNSNIFPEERLDIWGKELIHI